MSQNLNMLAVDTVDTIAGSFGNFDLLRKHPLKIRDITMYKWRSRITGLNVLHLDYQGECLVFMGSEKYPYKGVLDNLANRAFSEGTNAWTDTDHTCYTIETVGQEGFLQLLPVYADHILYPTITDHAFLTEVHHIDGKGHNSGVVYSEMQGRENTPGDLMALRMARLVNSSGSAYRSETGGLMAALRVLTAQQIRDYHRKYYVPHNLCLIICGSVSQQSLLQVLQTEIEPSIVKHAFFKPHDWRRPFLETPTAHRIHLTESKKQIVEFPEEDEVAGEVLVSLPGSSPTDYLTGTAVEILASYLTSSPVAPLNKEFIETSTPLCTDISIVENPRVKFCDLDIYASSVPTDRLSEFDVRLRKTLKEIADKSVDMVRMQLVIDRERRQFLSRIESSGGDVFSAVAISDFLYGAWDGTDLPNAMNQLVHYNELSRWSADQWNDVLRKYFVFSHYAVVYGKPSVKLAGKLEAKERDRVEKQVAKLGADGLVERTKLLETAQAYNERMIPQEYFNSFRLPNVQNISWITVQSMPHLHGQPLKEGGHMGNAELSEHLSQDPAVPPYYIEYSHVKLLTTTEMLSHEDVINRLENETVSYEISLGLDGYFSQYVRVSINVEASKYDIALRWLHDLIYGSIFDKDRIQITAAKVQQSLPELKRDGNTVVSSLFGRMQYSSSSTVQAASILNQLEFISRLMQKLKSAPETVIQDLETFRDSLTRTQGLRFGVTGNVLAQSNPKESWLRAFPSIDCVRLDPIPSAFDTLSPLGLNPGKQAFVMSLPSIESAYTVHSTKTIRGFDHVDFPTLRVSLEVLNATEGFLWRVIRGAGLAYSAYIILDLEVGTLSFSTYRSSSPFRAYQEAKNVVHDLAYGKLALEESMLDSCKSAIVYAVAKRVSTPGKAVSLFLNSRITLLNLAKALTALGNETLREVPASHTTDLLEQYQKVTVQDVVACIRKYILPIFDPERSFAAVVSSPAKLEDIIQGLESVGFLVERQELLTDIDDGDSDSDMDSSMTYESR
ncbi:hypothetical protein Clacol_003709 [Clathrus columnatus]|uniref:Peptidase M16 C-terminal domain-containing protein n=1 Tax=Clathrus columnatus TaxID=1419009 RepID=A0AAV5AAE3_9AGAM|nr:hypothetical protein Clacol_003709 [Clathrus columnatus]